MAKVQQWLLCLSVVVLLVTPSCSAARSLRASGRHLLTSTAAYEDEAGWPKGTGDEGVRTSSLRKENEFKEWARFQAQEVAVDYTPAGANPDPGIPSPIGP